MISKLKFVLIVGLIVLWGVAGIGFFIYMVAGQFNCTFLKAIIYAVLCVAMPIGFIVGVDPLAARLRDALKNTALPTFLTDTSLKLISMSVVLLAFFSIAGMLLFVADKAPI
ncbi:MAG: hypothetical protein QG574_4088 [Cyanobacteriota bacterium erpe_2018_sw_21hr_WHONDRS-SW48-000092_B_bin.40]|jgi:hypothetical protein|nr:hypothetical protein [Cyanobacteriota bacterium erpe_2018_sw_21hr_WHONDRS-SW48-000092_B_bin.40]